MVIVMTLLFLVLFRIKSLRNKEGYFWDNICIRLAFRNPNRVIYRLIDEVTV